MAHVLQQVGTRLEYMELANRIM